MPHPGCNPAQTLTGQPQNPKAIPPQLVMGDLEMKKKALLHMLCAAGLTLSQSAFAQPDKNVEDLNDQTGPPKLGIHWSRDFDPNPRATNDAKTAGPRNRNPNMTYH